MVDKGDKYFPKREEIVPMIYAYKDKSPGYEGLLKIGYTTRSVEERVAEQYGVNRPVNTYTIVFQETAIRKDGTYFKDTDVHKKLRENGFANPSGEWFKCSENDLKNAVIAIKEGKNIELSRTENFKMRPEQEQAVEITYNFFKKSFKEHPDKVPHFLWNAKMRFGKTFTAYQLAKKMEWTKILILTFKPAVQDAWEEDLKRHIDFEGWQFLTNKSIDNDLFCDQTKPFVFFASFQDILGKTQDGGIKAKNKRIHEIEWDCIILDEYHYGAWRDKSKNIFKKEDEEIIKEEEESIKGTGQEYFDETIMPITTKSYLYLSGTPFRAIRTGEFIEDEIYSWTYSDEQKAKNEWKGEGENPYKSLPQMIMLTYKLPNNVEQIAFNQEINEFDLNIFFKAEGEGENAQFIYKNEVQKWLDFIRGNNKNNVSDEIIVGNRQGSVPFKDARLLSNLTHTLWFFNDVASCYAMRNLLKERQNMFFDDYKIIVMAGKDTGNGIKALEEFKKEIGENTFKTKSITLSCGKLTTGVTIKEWSGIFMLRNLNSPETYFQAAFRVQSPWTITDYENNKQVTKILKEKCYVFDFAPNRALNQLAEYSNELDYTINKTKEEKIDEFIRFLPVLSYENGELVDINASEILDKIISGTTASLLAKKWESALLVNVDNITLNNILNNEEALKILENIVGFRNLNQKIETIINKSENVKELKKKSGSEGELSKEEKEKMTTEEKEIKSKRQEIRDKLIKFATRIPIFMYLTDYREEKLKDVIIDIEPKLFKKVTGLNVKDFELLVSLNLFNNSLMNDAVYKFRRYEDSSLEYSGIKKPYDENENIGLFDTVINKNEYLQDNHY